MDDDGVFPLFIFTPYIAAYRFLCCIGAWQPHIMAMNIMFSVAFTVAVVLGIRDGLSFFNGKPVSRFVKHFLVNILFMCSFALVYMHTYLLYAL